jgi:hypothetical protein
MINLLKNKLQKHAIIGLTGSLSAGKDFVATSMGCSRESMALPIYKMVEHFFGLEDPDRSKALPPGMRECWQTFGQWGKGIVSQQYPLTPERAIFENHVRNHLWRDLLHEMGDTFGVRWQDYGRDDALWIDAMVRRLSSYPQGLTKTLRAVTNLRFRVETDAFVKQGWPIVHVLVSPATLRARQDAQGVSEEARNNVSEQLATQLNETCYHVCHRSTPTPDLRDWLNDNGFGWADAVVWNDEKEQSPTDEFLTVGQMKAMVCD